MKKMKRAWTQHKSQLTRAFGSDLCTEHPLVVRDNPSVGHVALATVLEWLQCSKGYRGCVYAVRHRGARQAMGSAKRT